MKIYLIHVVLRCDGFQKIKIKIAKIQYYVQVNEHSKSQKKNI